MKKLRDRRVLITGGAQGIGLAIARRFAEDGARIVLSDIDAERLEAARELLAGEGAECRTVVADVTDFDGLGDFRRRVLEAGDGLEILINNAGVVHGGAFLEVPLEQHLGTLRVNTEAVVAVTHTFLGDLIAADAGHLVNVASASGFIGLPWASTYAASKSAVIGFSESVRIELRRLGHRHVGVTTVCPSYVRTGMFDGVREPLMTPFLTPRKLARKVHKAVRKNDPFVLEPAMVKITPLLKAALPTGASDLLLDTFGVSTGMKSWRGK